MSRQSVRIVRVVALSGATAVAVLALAGPGAAATEYTAPTRPSLVATTPGDVVYAAAITPVTNPGATTGINSGPATTGTDANLTNTTTAGTIAGGTLVFVLLVGATVGAIRSKKVPPGWAFALIVLGVLAGGTTFGPTIRNTADSIGSSIGSTVSGFTQ